MNLHFTPFESWLLIGGFFAVLWFVVAPLLDRAVDWLTDHCAWYRRLGEAPTRDVSAIPSMRDAENAVRAERRRLSALVSSSAGAPTSLRGDRVRREPVSPSGAATGYSLIVFPLPRRRA